MHLAIIMDGNSRWSQENNYKQELGYSKGAEVAKEIVLHCTNINISYLTLYAFSIDNWHREPKAVETLMYLFEEYLYNSLNELQNYDIRVTFIGEIHYLNDNMQQCIQKIEKATRDNHKLYLNIAMSYGGQEEIVYAVKSIVKNKTPIDVIDNTLFSSYLYTKSIPPPDLLIRTGREKRLSNFLLWQIAYTEFYFSDILWPDFTTRHLDEILTEYVKRSRRYGI